MTLQITIDQSGKPAGVPGRAREDLDLGTAVLLTLVGGVGVVAYQWSILYKPLNAGMTAFSSAALTTPTAASTSVTPVDLAGTYRIECQVDCGYGLGARAEDVTRITFYAGPALAADPAQLPRRRLAAFEEREHNAADTLEPAGNTDGWAREWEKWFRVIEACYAAAASIAFGTPVSVTRSANAPGSASTHSRSDHKHDVSVGTPVTIGAANTQGSSSSLAAADHGHDHGALAGGDRHALVSQSAHGFMAAGDKGTYDAQNPPRSLAYSFNMEDVACCKESRAYVSPYLLGSGWTKTNMTVGALSGGYFYPVSWTTGTGRLISATAVNAQMGYVTARVLIKSEGQQWVCIEIDSVNDVRFWVDITNQVAGTNSAVPEFVSASVSNYGGGWSLVVFTINHSESDPPILIIRPAAADGDYTSSVTGRSPGFSLMACDTTTGEANPRLIQRMVSQVHGVGARIGCRLIRETLTPTPRYPSLYNPTQDEWGRGGILFRGDGIDAGEGGRHLFLVDPNDSASGNGELTEPGAPWAAYFILGAPQDTSAAYHMGFGLSNEPSWTRYVVAGFYGSNFIMEALEPPASAVQATVAASGSKALYVAYYQGGKMRVRRGATMGTETTKLTMVETTFTTINVGGIPPGSLGMSQLEAMMYGFHLGIGVTYQDTADTNICNWIAGVHAVSV